MTSSSFTPNQSLISAAGTTRSSCSCVCGAALQGRCDRIWILLSWSMLLTSRGRKKPRHHVAPKPPAVWAGLFLPPPPHTSLSRASTRCSTFNPSRVLQSLGHDGLGCWEAETNFSAAHIEETCREPSKAELIQTVRAVQNVSFEMNKFACYIEEDTDPAFFFFSPQNPQMCSSVSCSLLWEKLILILMFGISDWLLLVLNIEA